MLVKTITLNKIDEYYDQIEKKKYNQIEKIEQKLWSKQYWSQIIL